VRDFHLPPAVLAQLDSVGHTWSLSDFNTQASHHESKILLSHAFNTPVKTVGSIKKDDNFDVTCWIDTPCFGGMREWCVNPSSLANWRHFNKMN